MEAVERNEGGHLDRVGRRLATMLEAVKTAKNVAKPVQQALAEAIDSYKHAQVARFEYMEARTLWAAKLAKEHGETDRLPSTIAPTHAPKTDLDSALAEIAREIKGLRREVGKLRSVQEHSAESQTVHEEKWSEVVGRKPWVPRGLQRPTTKTTTEGDNIASAKPRVCARPPEIMVDVKPEDFPALARKIRDGVDRGNHR